MLAKSLDADDDAIFRCVDDSQVVVLEVESEANADFENAVAAVVMTMIPRDLKKNDRLVLVVAVELAQILEKEKTGGGVVKSVRQVASLLDDNRIDTMVDVFGKMKKTRIVFWVCFQENLVYSRIKNRAPQGRRRRAGYAVRCFSSAIGRFRPDGESMYCC